MAKLIVPPQEFELCCVDVRIVYMKFQEARFFCVEGSKNLVIGEIRKEVGDNGSSRWMGMVDGMIRMTWMKRRRFKEVEEATEIVLKHHGGLRRVLRGCLEHEGELTKRLIRK